MATFFPQAALLLAGFALILASIPVLVYPAAIWLAARLLGPKAARTGSCRPTVDLVVVTTASPPLIRAKLENTLSLDYPSGSLRTILAIDGSADEVRDVTLGFDAPMELVETVERVGKNLALNRAVAVSTAEILVFSDADARLASDAVSRLCEYFADPSVGGVCGRRVIEDPAPGLIEAQRSYFRFDSWLKAAESLRGSLSSNDGKLYAMRKQLFEDLPPVATDDLYNCLTVTLQRRRFLYAPLARAWVPKPSRSPGHEVERRRRIVCTSLAGIFARPALLFSRFHCGHTVRLLVNKVWRRAIPFFLLIAFAVSILGAFRHPLLALLAALQVAGLGWALFGLAMRRRSNGRAWWVRTAGLAGYFLAGNCGTLLGVLDFLRGRDLRIWEPRKTD